MHSRLDNDGSCREASLIPRLRVGLIGPPDGLDEESALDFRIKVTFADQVSCFARRVIVGCRIASTQFTVYFASFYVPGAEKPGQTDIGSWPELSFSSFREVVVPRFLVLSYPPLLITLIARPLFCASRCARLSSAHPCAEQARIGGRWSSAICLRWPIDAPLPKYILNGCTSPVHHDHPLGGRRRLSEKKSIGGRGEFGELER